MPKNFFVITYDIASDKNRRKISDTLLDYGGKRVQYSVFECEMTNTNFQKLYKKLHKLRKPSDSIRYYFLCKRCLQRVRLDEDAEMRERMPEYVSIIE